MIRVRVESDDPAIEEEGINGEYGYAEDNPSGYPNVVVFLDCDGNDVPSYFGWHELVVSLPTETIQRAY